MPAKSPLFELRQSEIQGKGAFALRPIRKGTRVIEYTGERIDQDEADRRYEDAKMRRHHTFLFSLDSGQVIDAAVGGNEARFINHSCDPNCQAIEEDGRIFIEALRAIQPGEELAYDYAYERTEHTTPEDEKLYACRCGSPKCRGTILAPAKPEKKRAAAKAKKKGAKKGKKGNGGNGGVKTRSKAKAGAKAKGAAGKKKRVVAKKKGATKKRRA